MFPKRRQMSQPPTPGTLPTLVFVESTSGLAFRRQRPVPFSYTYADLSKRRTCTDPQFYKSPSNFNSFPPNTSKEAYPISPERYEWGKSPITGKGWGTRHVNRLEKFKK